MLIPGGSPNVDIPEWWTENEEAGAIGGAVGWHARVAEGSSRRNTPVASVKKERGFHERQPGRSGCRFGLAGRRHSARVPASSAAVMSAAPRDLTPPDLTDEFVESVAYRLGRIDWSSTQSRWRRDGTECGLTPSDPARLAVGMGVMLAANRAMPPDMAGTGRARNPLKRLGQTSEMAATPRFLATEAHYVTGQGIDVDGGYQRALLELHGQLVPVGLQRAREHCQLIWVAFEVRRGGLLREFNVLPRACSLPRSPDPAGCGIAVPTRLAARLLHGLRCAVAWTGALQ